MSRRVLSRHSHQFDDINEYLHMVRLISESEVPRGLHYNRQTGVYKPNLQGLAVLMFEDVWDRSIFCDRIFLSGGAPDTEDFVKVDNGGF